MLLQQEQRRQRDSIAVTASRVANDEEAAAAAAADAVVNPQYPQDPEQDMLYQEEDRHQGLRTRGSTRARMRLRALEQPPRQ